MGYLTNEPEIKLTRHMRYAMHYTSTQTKPNALRPKPYALRKSRGEAPTIAGFPPFIFFLAEPPPIGARSLPLS